MKCSVHRKLSKCLMTSREMSNILEKFKNVTHLKVNPTQKSDNLLRCTLNLFHSFLNDQNILQEASQVAALRPVHCLLHCLLPFVPH